MSGFIDALAEYVRDELYRQVAGAGDAQLRLMFAGPPANYLQELYACLTQGGTQPIRIDSVTGAQAVPVYLLSNDVDDPTDRVLAAHCSPSYYVAASRNNPSVPISLALRDASTNLSVQTAVTSLGMHANIIEHQSWKESQLVQYLLEQAVNSMGFTGKLQGEAKETIAYALSLAWQTDERHRDKRTAWSIIRSLLDYEFDIQHPHLALSSVLGMPWCTPEQFGTKNHHGVVTRLSQFIESQGLRGSLNYFLETAEPDVRTHLYAFGDHLHSANIIDSSDFCRSPHTIYRPGKSAVSDLPEWWEALSVDAWEKLLDSTGDDSKSGVIDVRPVNSLFPIVKGMPHVLQDEVALEICSAEIESEITAQVMRGSGTAKQQCIDEIQLIPNEPTEFIDSDIPQHERYLTYSVIAEGLESKKVKVVSLEQYGPGLVAICKTADKTKPFSLNKKATAPKGARMVGKKYARYDTDISLSQMGQHSLDIYKSSKISLSPPKLDGHEINSEHDTIECQLNEINPNHSVSLITSDEECYYDFTIARSGDDTSQDYRIYFTAKDVEPAGATSEFDRLVMAHRSGGKGNNAVAKVFTPNSRITSIEEWAMDHSDSYYPMVLGPDYLSAWRKPRWEEDATITDCSLPIDPRPNRADFQPPEDFLTAREAVRGFLRGNVDEHACCAGELKLWEFMRDDQFSKALSEYLDAYLRWLEVDFTNAAWVDVVSIHAQQSNSQVLESTPYSALLSPLHPVRLAWQCSAQDLLQRPIDNHGKLCPAASVLDPSSFPDCMVLPCRTAAGAIETKHFIGVQSSSDYWGVYWSKDEVSRLTEYGSNEKVFGTEFGIHLDGLSQGFGSKQVVRAMGEVSRLASARSTLRIAISSDTIGSGTCNDGVEEWCSANLGAEQDEWGEGALRSVEVTDRRASHLQPEQSIIASLALRTDSAVNWYTAIEEVQSQEQDLSIIARLGTISHDFGKENTRSPIDPSGLMRWRIRKQLPHQNVAFIAESRVGEVPSCIDQSSIPGKLLSCVDVLERKWEEKLDCYIFSPDMESLGYSVKSSKYTAVSASNVDAASFFGPTADAYMWDYELPAYSRTAGENSGFFLLASESPTMLLAVRQALKLIGESEDIDTIEDSVISDMLHEVSRRGMPTLKRLTGGGAMSLGELGMLIALRLLQSDFEEDADERPSLIPVIVAGESINLIVPADPFQGRFDDLRDALGTGSKERPDLIVMSIGFNAGLPVSLKLTPIEVKARKDVMADKSRKDALKQASKFAAFLKEFQDQAGTSELWAVAYRSLLAMLLDYGFRVYGQLDKFMNQEDWVQKHAATLQALVSGDLEVSTDMRGRAIVVDDSKESRPLDLDQDGFKDTVVVKHDDAFKLFAGDAKAFMNGVVQLVGDWELTPPDLKTPTQDQAVTQIDSPQEVSDVAQEAPATETDESPSSQPTAEVSDAGVGIVADATETSVDAPEDQESQETTQESERGSSGQGGLQADAKQGLRFSVGHTVKGFTEEQIDFHPGNTRLNQLNIGVVGDLGTGKTQLIQSLIYQIHSGANMNRGVTPNVLIFDYKRDYTKEQFVKATNATVVKPYDIPLNLFDTRDSQNKRNTWLSRSKFFTDILSKIYSGIGPLQRQRIKAAVRESYDQASAFGYDYPTMSNVFTAYHDIVEGNPDTPYSIMSDLVDGEHFVSEASQVVPFSEFMKGVVVLDLADAGQDDKTKNMLVVIFLNLFYEHMLNIEKRPFVGDDPFQHRVLDSMLLVDEADNIMQYEFDVLSKILLQGREFGVGVLLASQYLSHFKTTRENYMEPLLTWFLHKVPSLTTKDLENIGLVGVGADMVQAVKELECHQCLAKTLDVEGKVIRGTPFYEIMQQLNS